MIEIIAGIFLLISGLNSNRITYTEKAIAKSNNEFSFKIFKMLSKDENDVMSSLSILSALSILMNGANNETLDDMKRFLQFNDSVGTLNDQVINEGFRIISEKYKSDEKTTPGKEVEKFEWDLEKFKHQLNMANRVVYSKRIQLLPEFINTVKQYFRGDIQRADFENNAVEETNKVNEWVRNQTNHKIQKIFDKLERDTTTVIINVLYFKGHWAEYFSESQTEKLNFYNNGVTAVQTDMMSNEHRFNYADSTELDSQVLELEYMGGDISFVVVLPKKKEGLKLLKEKINASKLSFEKALESVTIKNVKVHLPKFKVEKSYDLMKDINPKPIALTRKADLSRMTSVPSVVDKIQHKVVIEVNEKGTEAAAVTALKVIPISYYEPNETILFNADHPFLYFIRDKSNSMILFSGQINKL